MHVDDVNTNGCRDLVSGLARAQPTPVFISPGSRNTPLALAFAVSPAFDDVSVRDERAAGFAALGWAKSTGRPAIVVCTSGSAGTHYFPSVVEADQSATAMIVITSDRPVLLRGTSAPQTLDQTDLFGRHVKIWIDVDIAASDLTETGSAAMMTASEGIPGPVHLNVPLDEPLTPMALPDAVGAGTDSVVTTADPVDLSHALSGRNVVVVAGGFHGADFSEELSQWCAGVRAPLVAGPQARAQGPTTINGDLLAASGVFDADPPDLVLRLGTLPPSKAVMQWLAAGDTDQIVVHHSRLAEPLGTATQTIAAHPINILRGTTTATVGATYTDRLTTLSHRAETAAHEAIMHSFPSEPLVARHLTRHVPEPSMLVVGSSMPIRDVETFGHGRSNVVVFGNRGVNGIDGILATALGAALSGTPTTVLCGDVSALHDATTLTEIARLRAPLRVVVVNNDGGGIFSFLPQHRSRVVPDDLYERHWGTPHGLSLVDVASAFGLTARPIDDEREFIESVTSPIVPELIEVTTDRTENVAIHDRVRQAVRRAVAD